VFSAGAGCTCAHVVAALPLVEVVTMRSFHEAAIEQCAVLCEMALTAEADAVCAGDLELAARMADVAEHAAVDAFEWARSS
jgi:hypothetical protein